MAKFLSHPLVILLAGAIITGLLIPWFTRRWLDRQKELEIKTQLVSDISESTINVITRIRAVRILRTWLPQRASDEKAALEDERMRNQYEEAFDAMNQAYYKFAIQSAVIGAKLKAYLPDAKISLDWGTLSDIVMSFYALEGIHGEEKLKQYKDELRQKLSELLRLETTVGEDWIEIQDQILKAQARLIQGVLKSRILGFRSSWLL